MWDYAPIALTWFAATLKDLAAFSSNDKVTTLRGFTLTRKHQAWTVMAIATAGAILAALTVHDLKTGKKITPFEGMEKITEASGVAVVGDQAFVVGDESTQPLVRLDWTGDHYERATVCTVASNPRPNDLEAIAVAPSGQHLWLLTSHSNTAAGEEGTGRRMLVEATLPAASAPCALAITQTRDLRPAMLRALSALPMFTNYAGDSNGCSPPRPGCGSKNELGNYDVLQAEGLTLDKGGKFVFIGLRAPLIEDGLTKRAIVLRAPSGDLFTPDLKFDVTQITMRVGSEHYGIASLDLDRETGQFVILGTHESRGTTTTPVICLWDPNAQSPINAAPISAARCRALPRFAEPVPWAQPEGLAFAPNRQVVVFLDGDNRHYGMAVYSRSELGL